MPRRGDTRPCRSCGEDQMYGEDMYGNLKWTCFNPNCSRNRRVTRSYRDGDHKYNVSRNPDGTLKQVDRYNVNPNSPNYGTHEYNDLNRGRIGNREAKGKRGWDKW